MDDDWALIYPGCNFTFGRLNTTGYGFRTDPIIGPAESTTSEIRRANSDGVTFGRDNLGGRTVTFDLLTAPSSNQWGGHDSNLQEAFEEAWQADTIRQQPGAVATLRASTGRVAFGRPRRHETQDRLFTLGRSRILADFATVDANWYGDEESASVPFAPIARGGLVTPLVSPLTTTRAADTTTALAVLGKRPTPLRFVVTGPITDPEVVIGNLRFAFAVSLLEGESLVLDARPWMRTIRIGSGSAAGKLTTDSSRISDAVLRPGAHVVALRGVSASATSTLTVLWRPSYSTF